jgi:hypothetical protein
MKKQVPLHTGKSLLKTGSAPRDGKSSTCNPIIIPTIESPIPIPIPKKNDPTVSFYSFYISSRKCALTFLLLSVDLVIYIYSIESLSSLATGTSLSILYELIVGVINLNYLTNFLCFLSIFLSPYKFIS